MNQDSKQESMATSVARVRGIEVSVGLVLRLPLNAVDDLIATLENACSGRVLYQKVSVEPLWITTHRPS